MGFFSALDTAVAGHKAQKEAAQFAATVQLGKTYYTVVRHQQPYGGTHELIHEHIATSRSRITGQPMFGHKSASALWLTEGPVYTDRTPGLQTIREETEANNKQVGPQIHGHISDY